VSGNPSSPHEEGRSSRELLEEARVAIARLVECKSDDIIFTGGATEANALAILGAVRAARGAGVAQPHALYHPGSHASIVENMRLAEREGAVIEALPLKGAEVDCEELAKKLRRETVLISLEAVCGETGVVWNTREISRILGHVGRRTSYIVGPSLHVDASQAPWTEKLTRAHFGADLMTLDSSKVCEARGIGCLIAPRTVVLEPLYAGGGQERGLRPGSEAPALAAAFAEGLRRAAKGRDAFRDRAGKMRRSFLARLEGVSGLVVNEGSGQAPHILNISLLQRDTDYLVALLDEAGFAVSTRSACETDRAGSTINAPSEQSSQLGATFAGSRAVFALFGEEERARATLRISWGRATRERDLERFAKALRRNLAFIDNTSSA
jgi:cysteine desulfurase